MGFNPEEENAGADDPHGLGKMLTHSQEPVSHLEEEEVDWSQVPQGKPEGSRVGGDSERRQENCSTCRGQGTYSVQFFEEPDDVGHRELKVKLIRCATCFGTGKETIL